MDFRQNCRTATLTYSRLQAALLAECPLWGKSRRATRQEACPLYPQKPPRRLQPGAAAKGHKLTCAPQQIASLFDYLVGAHTVASAVRTQAVSRRGAENLARRQGRWQREEHRAAVGDAGLIRGTALPARFILNSGIYQPQVEVHWRLCDEKPLGSFPGRFGGVADSI
jgi:hypothetical protein